MDKGLLCDSLFHITASMMSSLHPFFSLFPEILFGGGDAARAEGRYTQGEEMNGIEIHHVKDIKNKFKNVKRNDCLFYVHPNIFQHKYKDSRAGRCLLKLTLQSYQLR